MKELPKNETEDEIKELTNQLKVFIGEYLDNKVKTPALQTVDNEFQVQKDIGTILVLFTKTEQLILDHGSNICLDTLSGLNKEELQETLNILNSFIDCTNKDSSKKKAEKILKDHSHKKHLLAYLVREINWISVSILSASYISSLTLIRSVFELLIGIASSKNGSMTCRIESISYLTREEQKEIKKIWNKLNAWAHPYGKWEKEICPVFYSNQPRYHPKLYKECFSKFAFITDLFLTIAVERFKIAPQEITIVCEELSGELIDDYFKNFPLFLSRITNANLEQKT